MSGDLFVVTVCLRVGWGGVRPANVRWCGEASDPANRPRTAPHTRVTRPETPGWLGWSNPGDVVASGLVVIPNAGRFQKSQNLHHLVGKIYKNSLHFSRKLFLASLTSRNSKLAHRSIKRLLQTTPASCRGHGGRLHHAVPKGFPKF